MLTTDYLDRAVDLYGDDVGVVEFREDLPWTSTGTMQKFELRQPRWQDEEANVG